MLSLNLKSGYKHNIDRGSRLRGFTIHLPISLTSQHGQAVYVVKHIDESNVTIEDIYVISLWILLRLGFQ